MRKEERHGQHLQCNEKGTIRSASLLNTTPVVLIREGVKNSRDKRERNSESSDLDCQGCMMKRSLTLCAKKNATSHAAAN